MKRLKQLEQENRRLKKRVADVSLDNQILKEVFSRRSGPSPAGLGRVIFQVLNEGTPANN